MVDIDSLQSSDFYDKLLGVDLRNALLRPTPEPECRICKSSSLQEGLSFLPAFRFESFGERTRKAENSLLFLFGLASFLPKPPLRDPILLFKYTAHIIFPLNRKDLDAGDVVCTNCGAVSSERAIAYELTDYRVFADDGANSGKEHYGARESIYSQITSKETGINIAFTPGTTSKKQTFNAKTLSRAVPKEDEDFIRDGAREIQRIVHSFTQGTTFNEKVVKRAQQIFARAYLKQIEEKRGSRTMEKTGKQRTHLARYRQFVVAGILQASREDADVRNRWTLELINVVLGGKPVSRQSVNRALRYVGL